MVGATNSSETSRSFSLSVAAADAGSVSARILKGAAASALLPLRNGRTSRAVRNRGRNRNRAHPSLMPAPHPAIISDNYKHNHNHTHNSNHSTDSLSGGRPGSDSDSSPPSSAASTSTRAPSSVPVLAITCGAIGGIIALVVVLAIVYVRRIRRRVKSMKRRTNVLGPELVPMSPSQLSYMSPIDSPRVKFDGKLIFPPQTTSELNNRLPPLSIPSVSSSPMSIELPGIVPLSPIRTSTIILSPPPPAKRSPIRSSNPNFHPNPHSNPRSPIRSSRVAVPWPLITALSSSDHPQHHYEEQNTSSDTLESTNA